MGAAAVPLILGGVALAGTAVSAVGQIQQASAAAKAAEAQGEEASRAALANAAIAQQQAQIAREQASQERRRAAIEAEVFAREARRRQGTRISAIGASGFTLSGSFLDLLSDAAMEDEQQRLFITTAGEEKARARLAGASIEELTSLEFARQAQAERRVGRAVASQARIAGGFGAAGTILTGATQTGLFLSQSPSVRSAFRPRPRISGFRERLA